MGLVHEQPQPGSSLLNVQAETLRFLYRGVPTALGVNIGIAILLSWVLWGRVDHRELLYWQLALGVTILLRAYGAWLFARAEHISQSINAWKYLFLIKSTLSGIVWGVSIWYFEPYTELETPILITFVLGGLTAGAAAILGSVLSVYYAYLYATMLPITIWFFSHRQESHTIMGIMLCVYILAMMAGGYLYRKVVLRSITLSNDLVDAKEQAEQANRAKSEFLSRMSHELRTPLNAIVGFGQLLEYSDISEMDRVNARHIVDAGRHLTNMVNEILDIARIESGHQIISKKPVFVKTVLMETWELVKPLADARGIRLQHSGPEECHYYIYIDQQRMVQVLLNLLSNAIKYNKEAGTITVSCRRDEKRIHIAIRDTGMGINVENLQRIFNPFERIGAETTTVEGSGIGLAVTRSLVHAMDGKIGVDSEPGQGSTFWIEFDEYDPQLNADVPGDSESLLEGLPVFQHGENTHILYIEDNQANFRLVEAVLSDRCNCQVSHARLGMTGLDKALQLSPDLILLDIHLPDMNGANVLARLREHEITRDIPVVILSADATAQQIEHLIKSGASSYLTKPFNIKDLVEVVATQLKS